MKTFKNHFAILLFAMMAVLSFTACEWDDSPEPDHPLYVTYTISATPSTFAGPDELAADIQAWIKANQKVYDVEVNYSTGDASEFATTDAQAVKRYDEFKSLLSTYITELQSKLAAGTYGSVSNVRVVFDVYAVRTQGNGGTLKYERIELVYPSSSAQ